MSARTGFPPPRWLPEFKAFANRNCACSELGDCMLHRFVSQVEAAFPVSELDRLRAEVIELRAMVAEFTSNA